MSQQNSVPLPLCTALLMPNHPGRVFLASTVWWMPFLEMPTLPMYRKHSAISLYNSTQWAELYLVTSLRPLRSLREFC